MSVYFLCRYYFERGMVHKIDEFVIQKVRELRQEKGISQSQLAFELNISTGFIAMVESGKYRHKYNLHHLNEIAKILGCTISDFLPPKPL